MNLSNSCSFSLLFSAWEGYLVTVSASVPDELIRSAQRALKGNSFSPHQLTLSYYLFHSVVVQELSEDND